MLSATNLCFVVQNQKKHGGVEHPIPVRNDVACPRQSHMTHEF